MIAIAGGGLAAQRCCERLRRRGYDGPITMVCDEPHAPYDRPPLSKEYLSGKMTAAPRLRPDGWHADHDVELLLDTRATGLRPATHELELNGDRTRLLFDKLLIATGAAPRTLPALDRFENVHVLRTLADADRLRDTLAPGRRVVVIGAGFIGQEVASTARGLGAAVTLIEAMPAPLAHIVGPEIGSWFARLHRAHGVDVRVGSRFAGAHGNGRVDAIELADGARVECDEVVVGIGVAPTTGWLAGSSLVSNGSAIAADHAGRTSLPDVFAAGDCAGSQHWEAAVAQGAGAALAMLGESPPAPSPTSFWSDLYGIRVNWLGRATGADDVSIEGDQDARDFAAIWRRDGRLIAGLLVGRPQQLPALRKELRDDADPEG